MTIPNVKLTKGIHVLHLFYRIDRNRWSQLTEIQMSLALSNLEAHCAKNSAISHPRVTSYTTIGGKADLAFFMTAAELGEVGQLHRDLEQCFPPGALIRAFTFLSVTELPEYITTAGDHSSMLIDQEHLTPDTDAFRKRFAELREKQTEYEHYRLYPELPDWEVMGFYPMSKRRVGADNWYQLDFAARKKLMAGHARVGRRYAGRVSQLITGSTGLDDWEWGVTLMAHQVDALKEIVSEMRFDEVSARYADFGPFFVNLRLTPASLWTHLHL